MKVKFVNVSLVIITLTTFLFVPWLMAQNPNFHNAPTSSKQLRNPYQDGPKAAEAGKSLYHGYCAKCHGQNGEGSGNVPSLAKGPAQSAGENRLPRAECPNRVEGVVSGGRPNDVGTDDLAN